MGEEYAVIIKTHRLCNAGNLDTPMRFTADQLLPIADVLITDYSSIFFDYLLFRKPIIFFAPDLETYLISRGIYPHYEELPGYHASEYNQLREGVLTMDRWADSAYHTSLDLLWEDQMCYCDGRSCEKLLAELNLVD